MIENMVETDSYWNHHNHHHFHADTEPAFVVRPGQSCCPDPEEECVCVTQDDVDYWNSLGEQVSAISSLTGIDPSVLSGLSNSAKLWNSNYDTVSANSAKWNNVSSVSSAFEQLSALSSLIESKNDKLYFDKSLSGNGTSANPYGIQNYDYYYRTFTKMVNLLFPDDHKPSETTLFRYDDKGNIVPNFVSITGKTEVDLPVIDNKIKENETDIKKLSSSDKKQEKQIEYLNDVVKNLQKGSGSTEIVKEIAETYDPETIKKLSGENTIYVSYDM